MQVVGLVRGDGGQVRPQALAAILELRQPLERLAEGLGQRVLGRGRLAEPGQQHPSVQRPRVRLPDMIERARVAPAQGLQPLPLLFQP